MGIGDDYAGGVVNIPENEVGGLPPHAGELQQLLHGVGHFAAVVPKKHLGRGDDVVGLGPEEAAGVNVFLHLMHIGLGEGFQSGEAGVERGGHLIDPLIGTLGGEPHGKKQLMGLGVLEGTDALRVGFFEFFHNEGGPVFLFHGGFTS